MLRSATSISLACFVSTPFAIFVQAGVLPYIALKFGVEKKQTRQQGALPEKVVGKKTEGGHVLYHVKWQGHGEEYNTWEPASEAFRRFPLNSEIKPASEMSALTIYNGSDNCASVPVEGGDTDMLTSLGPQQGRHYRHKPASQLTRARVKRPFH